MRLVAFDPSDAPIVAGWVTTADEAAHWASIQTLPDAGTFARWHQDADVVPFVLRRDDRPIAYGEFWEDRDADEAELARLLVDPAERGRGVGRWLARALADEARGRGFAAVWLRVVPTNTAAIAAYAAAGFIRASSDEETEFNTGQPQPYVWLRDATPA